MAEKGKHFFTGQSNAFRHDKDLIITNTLKSAILDSPARHQKYELDKIEMRTDQKMIVKNLNYAAEKLKRREVI